MKKIKYLLTIIIALLVFPSVMNAKTVTVCSSGCNYSSLDSAISDATGGDVIDISSGTYTLNKTTINKNLTLKGTDKSNTIIVPSGTIITSNLESLSDTSWIMVNSDANLTLNNLTFNGKGYETTGAVSIVNLLAVSGGLNVDNAVFKNVKQTNGFGYNATTGGLGSAIGLVSNDKNITLKNIEIENVERMGIVLSSGTGSGNVSITNYIYKGNGVKDFALFINENRTATLIGAVIGNTGEHAIYTSKGSSLVLKDIEISKYIKNGIYAFGSFTATNLTIKSPTPDDIGRAGIRLESSTDLINAIIENYSYTGGGSAGTVESGITAVGNVNLRLTNANIKNALGVDGEYFSKAIYIFSDTGTKATATIQNSDLRNNGTSIYAGHENNKNSASVSVSKSKLSTVHVRDGSILNAVNNYWGSNPNFTNDTIIKKFLNEEATIAYDPYFVNENMTTNNKGDVVENNTGEENIKNPQTGIVNYIVPLALIGIVSLVVFLLFRKNKIDHL